MTTSRLPRLTTITHPSSCYPRSRQRLSTIDYHDITSKVSPLFFHLKDQSNKLNDQYRYLIRTNPRQLLQKLQALQQKLYKIRHILETIRIGLSIPSYDLTLNIKTTIPRNIQKPFRQLSSLFKHLDRTEHDKFFTKIYQQTTDILRKVNHLDHEIILHSLPPLLSLTLPLQQRSQTTFSNQQISQISPPPPLTRS